MNSIKKILCVCLAFAMLLSLSVPAFAANGAKDGTGPSPQRLKDGTGCGGTYPCGGGGGGGAKDGTGPKRDGSGGNVNCPYLP